MTSTSWFKKLITYIVIILIWQISTEIEIVNVGILPSPIDVFKTLVAMFINADVYVDIVMSLWRVIVGFTLAAILGIVIGSIVAMNNSAKIYINSLIEILRPIPPIAFIPIAILWFGIGDGPAFFIVSFGAFFPIFTNTFTGVVNVNPIHKNAALCLGATRKLLLFDVILQSAMPFITSGLKTGIGVAWFCVIAAELVGAQSGLGYMIQLNRLTLQSEKVISGMIIIGIIGYLMNKLMFIIQKKLVPWSIKSPEN